MIDRFEKLLGKKNVSNSPEELKKYSVAGKIPSLLFFPTSIDHISEIIKSAKRDGKKNLIAGNNSQYSFGCAIETPDWCISLNRMNKIVEHEAADLIVTVEPGVTLPQLQKFLNKYRQFLPLDPISAQNRTLGGIVATNHSGPLRLLYGTCRDLVLGMKIVLPDATVIRAGGKTVKNVAGYDLCKLFIGSMGTLGIIAEITFKLYPSPAQSQTLWIEFSQIDELSAVIQLVGASNQVISRCEYFNAIFVEKYLTKEFQLKEPHCLLFNVQGQAEMVNATIEKLQQMVLDRGGKSIQNFSQKDDVQLWDQMRSLKAVDKILPFDFQCQISVPKSSLGKVINQIQKYATEAGGSIALQAHAGNGVLHIFWGNGKQEKMTPEQFRSAVESLRQIAQGYEGSMIVQDVTVPDMTVTSEVTVMSAPDLIWGKPGSDFALMKRIKTKYDPHGVFAAGRFIGGL